MIISNTVNDFTNNFPLSIPFIELYYEKNHKEFSDAGIRQDNLMKRASYTMNQLQFDMPMILKLNTKFVHIIFDIRLKFLKQYNTYLTPEIYLLIGSYETQAILPHNKIPSIYFFMEAISQNADYVYEIVAYYFAKLYLQITHLNEDTLKQEDEMIYQILNEMNIDFPYNMNN
ncbi:hypothetical protein [Mammaliicoccus stepanovicii]|uniref:Uncharacterized protein n=1 Tax=Mammaliicoccus stepanovicii TaxID=643214 RepID=A0A239YJ29_9STAP|nr:hypothetical protein [Mammaliicoccus stepanovicii]PNZ74695.1 hypothetical protein CD111_08575 [Mammaliicoccus stepanovicii]GGI40835.1 hypothetical protein GCM10010896_10350 [Mammaliicoccus stepanovicii]SNV58194.1 Uncharacterised protein [Mammaliicoccus stepanovicii]